MLTLYSKETTSFSTLGIGVLRDFISHPLITEELNGAYTLEFEYAKDGYLSEYLIEQNIIKADGQAFRIWNIKKDMQKITVFAKHIFFDLSFNFLADVFPTNLTAQSALEWMLNRAAVATNFSATGNCTQTASTRYVRKNFIDAVFNEDNALLKKFGGELSYDNFNITVHDHRGTNANFSIRYKKNLTGIDFNLDFSNVATRIVPIGFDGLTIDSTYVESPRASNYFTPLYKTYEFNDIKYDPDDEEAYHTLAEAKQALINAANELFTKNVDLPQVSIGVNFVELSKCSEYASYSNLERVHLGDTIDVIIPELNIHTSARVNKTVYDCILDRFITLEIGSAKQSITRTQIVIENQIRKSENYLTQAQQNAENLINHPFNGNVYIDKENGVIYLMDSTSPETAQNVWKWSLGGLGFSSTGINGTYTVAILQDGRINADFITTGQLDTGVIQGYDSLLIQVDTLDREFQKEINPTGVVSDSSITLEDSAKTELIDFELEGKTTQETRSGKNLFNINGNINTRYNGTTGNYNSASGNDLTSTYSNNNEYLYGQKIYVGVGKTITVSAKIKSFVPSNKDSTVGRITVFNDNTLSGGSMLTYNNDETEIKKLVFTPTTDYIYVTFGFVSPSSQQSSVTFTDIQVELGSTATEWEQYGVMPSPDYPSELVSVGYENIWDEQWENGYYNRTTGAKGSGSNYIRCANYIPIAPNTHIYFNKPDDFINYAVLFYDSSFTKLGSTATINTTSQSFTSPMNASYFTFYGDTGVSGATYQNNIIITKGIQPRSYIPYGKYGIEIETKNSNLIGLDTKQYKVNMLQGQKITAKNTTSTALTLNLYTNYGDTTRNDYWTIGSNSTRTITLAHNIGAMAWTSNVASDGVAWVNKGDTIHNYEEYTSNTYLYTLDNPLRSIGDTKDLLYIKNGMLYVERKIGGVVLNGSENWTLYSASGSTVPRRFGIRDDNLWYKNGINLLSNYFIGGTFNSQIDLSIWTQTHYLAITDKNSYWATSTALKTWLSTHNTEVQYELAEPYIEELGQVDMPSTYKGITHLNTTDELEPNMDITYVRDTLIANYVESHVNEIKITEKGIESRVQSIEAGDYGTRINAVEERTTDTEHSIDIISTNIDTTTGEVRRVTTTTGFTFNEEGMSIEDSSSNFKALHRNTGTTYYDGNTIVGQYTKDGSKQKDLDLFGVYTYGKNDINDTPMFIAQLFTDGNGEEGFGHFYNRGD